MLLHVKDPSQSDMKNILICTVDTDNVAISIGLLQQLYLSELWLEIRTAKHLRMSIENAGYPYGLPNCGTYLGTPRKQIYQDY